MSDKYLAEPDLDFIDEVVGLGGSSLKKCYQCATCSVVCPISPDNKPFPRKEMIAASWGLRDRLTHNLDVWLCHQCGDCSVYCPRGAKPGDVLSAVRSYAISDYATPKALARAVNDPKKLPLLIAVPAIIIAVLAFVTMTMGGTMDSIFKAIGMNALGFKWAKDIPEGVIAHGHFFSTWFVDLLFIPLATLAGVVFALGLYRFINDIHEQAVQDQKVTATKLDLIGLVKGIIAVIPKILKHDKFNECTENRDRSTAHMMVLFAFIGLLVTTGFAFVFLYVLGKPGPYPQWYPFKLLGNLAGISLIIGSLLMIKNRLAKKDDQVTDYKDWYLIGLALGLGLSGMLAQMTRLAGAETLTYFLYYIHLIFVFHLFAFLPFSKMAHFVYRTVAMGYAEYAGREKK